MWNIGKNKQYMQHLYENGGLNSAQIAAGNSSKTNSSDRSSKSNSSNNSSSSSNKSSGSGKNTSSTSKANGNAVKAASNTASVKMQSTSSAPKYQVPAMEAPVYNTMTSEAPTYNAQDISAPTYNPTGEFSYVLPDNGIGGVNDMILSDILSSYKPSQAVTDAMNYLQGMASSLGGGTQYTAQLNQLINKYNNREAFSYDPDKDTLFQHALASAMNAGKTAMQDTMGQAAALTGGYGSTYATSAANNAYNNYIEGAYDDLPSYYGMALDSYNAEDSRLLNQISILQQQDANAYNQMVNSFNAYSNYANMLYSQDFGAWQNNVSNKVAYAQMANNNYWNNLNMMYQMHRDSVADSQWQYVNDYNQYRDSVADSQWQYNTQYNQYRDSVADSQWKYINDYNQYRDSVSDYQWQQSYDFNVQQAGREQDNWERSYNFDLEQARLDNEYRNATLEYQKNRDEIEDEQWQKSYDLDNRKVESSIKSDERYADYRDNALAEDKRQFDITNGINADGTKMENTSVLSKPTQSMFKDALEEYEEGGEEALYRYVASVDDSKYNIEALYEYVLDYGNAPIAEGEFTKIEDTMNGLLWTGNIIGKVDGNDVVSVGGRKMTISEAQDELESYYIKNGYSTSEAKKKAKEVAKNLTDLKKNQKLSLK